MAVCIHEAAIKNGKTAEGLQRWKCKECKRNFVITIPEDMARIVKQREPILRRRIRNKVINRWLDQQSSKLEKYYENLLRVKK